MREALAKAVGDAMWEYRRGRTLMPWMASPERTEALKYVEAMMAVLCKPSDQMIKAMQGYAVCAGYFEEGWEAAIKEALK